MPSSNNDYARSRHGRPQGAGAQQSGPAHVYRAPQAQAQLIAARIPQINDEQAAPRPIGVDPSETGSFARITAEQGARVEDKQTVARVSPDATASWAPIGYGAEMRLQGRRRPAVKRREKKLKADRNLFVGLGIAAAVVVLIVSFLVYRAATSSSRVDPNEPPAQVQAGIDQSVQFGGDTYHLVQLEGGTWALASQNAAGETIVFECTGLPVQLILSNGAILVPQNVGEGWNVLAYTLGGSSVAAEVVDAEGNPVTGSGSIEALELEPDALVVHDSTGARTQIAL